MGRNTPSLLLPLLEVLFSNRLRDMPQRRFRPCLEVLESRVLLAVQSYTLLWHPTKSLDWSGPANWLDITDADHPVQVDHAPGRLSGAADNVVFDGSDTDN